MAPLGPGTELAGFRLERVIGQGSAGTVYEATQLSLDRRVALRLLPTDPELAERFRRLPSLEHPGAVGVYATGTCEHGLFVATQLVDGPTLAELRGAGRLGAREEVEILAGVASALDAAHDAGLVHGRVTARNVLIDSRGRGLLSDFGLGPAEATPATDRAAFAALVGERGGPPSGDSATEIVQSAAAALPAPRPRRILALGALGALVVAAAVVALLAGGDSEPQGAPAVERGARVLGSALAAGRVSSVDCGGQPPSGASQACTLLQTRLPGRAVGATRGGAIRRWAVRGARGQLALQVLRRRGSSYVWVARGPYQAVPDGGVHVLPVSLPVRAGDVVGVAISPGSAIGVRRGVPGATTARWLGPLRAAISEIRRVEEGAGTGFDHEVLLRVDYVPGAKARQGGVLTGAAARRAPAGRRLGEQDVVLAAGQVRTLAVVRLGGRVAVDLLAGKRRLERLAVPDVNPRGSLLDLAWWGSPPVRLRWRNPDGRLISHDFVIRARSIEPRG